MYVCAYYGNQYKITELFKAKNTSPLTAWAAIALFLLENEFFPAFTSKHGVRFRQQQCKQNSYEKCDLRFSA